MFLKENCVYLSAVEGKSESSILAHSFEWRFYKDGNKNVSLTWSHTKRFRNPEECDIPCGIRGLHENISRKSIVECLLHVFPNIDGYKTTLKSADSGVLRLVKCYWVSDLCLYRSRHTVFLPVMNTGRWTTSRNVADLMLSYGYRFETWILWWHPRTATEKVETLSQHSWI
jgi:hypothetical protein